jgi:thiamine thiazole synthase
MEAQISRAIIRRYMEKFEDHLQVEVAIVGAGPCGMTAGRKLAQMGYKTALFERKLTPGGGIWGGGMGFNEIVLQDDLHEEMDELGIRTRSAGHGFLTVDAVEMASGLAFGCARAGAAFFNGISVEDIVLKQNHVGGVVINWSTVQMARLMVDPLIIEAEAVVDGTGHPSEITEMAVRKAGVEIDTPTGGIIGEKPMWAESGERLAVEHTKKLYPGLYVSGMAAINVSGGYRMGPVFGGMLKSGIKLADMIHKDLSA